MRALIINRASEAQLREAAHAADFSSMFQDGLAKVRDGQVAYDELLRVTEPDRPRETELRNDGASTPPPTVSPVPLRIVPNN